MGTAFNEYVISLRFGGGNAIVPEFPPDSCKEYNGSQFQASCLVNKAWGRRMKAKAEVGQEVKCNQQLIHDVIHHACATCVRGPVARLYCHLPPCKITLHPGKRGRGKGRREGDREGRCI